MAGIIVRRQDTGAVILRLTDRITRIVGSTLTISGSGSYVLPEVEGAYWMFVKNPGNYGNASSNLTLKGRTLSWSGLVASTQVVFGVY